MSFSFTSMVRLLGLMAVGFTMLAVGLSRLDPPHPTIRSLRPARYSNINEFFLNGATDRTPVWLDSQTGQMADFPLEDGDVLETASCSPWIDEKNQYQVVGRWTTRTKAGPMSISKDFGLARYTFPGGQMLDHVSTETVPVGPPCWFPGSQARILFNAGDGLLYHYAFEPEPWSTATNPQAVRDLKPTPIVWKCPKPGEGKVFLSDLSWPEDPRMGGCLVVSLRDQISDSKGIRKYTRNRLWWLKLNFAGTEIVDLGQLLDVNESESNNDHKAPIVGTLPDGQIVLAYLRQSVGENGWEARMAPIQFDANHTPLAIEAESVLLSSKCLPAQPSFSTDGHWLNAIVGTETRESHIARFPLDGLLTHRKMPRAE